MRTNNTKAANHVKPILKILSILAILVQTMAFTACEASGNSALADRWVLVEGPTKGNPENMELLKDGTGVSDNAPAKWNVENGRFYLTPSRGSYNAAAWSYKVQGSTLTLIDDNGKALVYKTKKGIEAAEAARLSKGAVSANPLKDSRDGKSYKAVKIGEQVWMAENLNFEAEGSKCYENKPENCAKYGRFYNWATAMKACPSGWHLPSNAEWDALYRFADGTSGTGSPYISETAGKYLKAKEGWEDNNGQSGNGTDNFGFAALPGGGDGIWWSSSEYGESSAYYRHMRYNYENAIWYNGGKSSLLSVRCLQD